MSENSTERRIVSVELPPVSTSPNDDGQGLGDDFRVGADKVLAPDEGGRMRGSGHRHLTNFGESRTHFVRPYLVRLGSVAGAANHGNRVFVQFDRFHFGPGNGAIGREVVHRPELVRHRVVDRHLGRLARPVVVSADDGHHGMPAVRFHDQLAFVSEESLAGDRDGSVLGAKESMLQSKPYKMFAATLQPFCPSRPKTKATLLFYFLKLYISYFYKKKLWDQPFLNISTHGLQKS